MFRNSHASDSMQKPTKNHRVASLFFAARWVLMTIGFGALSGAMTSAQVSGQPSAQPGGTAGALAGAPPQAQPLVITLDEAIARARTSDPSYAASRANSSVAALDHSIARSALLPSKIDLRSLRTRLTPSKASVTELRWVRSATL